MLFDEHASFQQTLGLTLYLILLYQYTGQSEIVIGLVTEQTQLWGLRADFSKQPTGEHLLKAVQTALQQIRQESRSPATTTPAAAPLNAFAALFINTSPLTTVQPSPLPVGVDLALCVEEHGAARHFTLLYNRALFAPSTIVRMAGHLQTLLTSLVADATQPVAQLSLLTATEGQQLLVEWNDTAAVYPEHLCIHQLIEQQVARTPQSVAVSFGTQHLTYQELDARANQVARHLCHLGVRPDDLVGIYIERSFEMVVGLLGILKAGGAYVPLDPHFPAERLTFMLEDANAQLLLTSSSLLAQLEQIVPTGQACHLICLDKLPESVEAKHNVSDWTRIAQEEASPPPTEVKPTHLAYCIYTSGSTGKPKGVEIEHRTVVNFLTTMRQAPGLTAQDVLLAITTISFDIAGLELYLPLTVGAKIILTTRTIAASGHLLAQLIDEVGTTVMQATPATWQLLLAAGWQGRPTLKMLCGGEALSQALASQLLTKGAALWNLYGPTETTIWSTVYQVPPRRQEPSQTTINSTAGRGRDTAESIGRPIANTQIYILNSNGQPVPIGVPGDLYIGGAGLARGYRHRPSLTAERFIENPFGKGRLYKTGDVARYLPDGNIDFLGRSDHQVKIRGFRIELGEIEAVLIRHPLVREVVVVARQDDADPEDKRLVAYLVLAPRLPEQTQGSPSVETTLRAYLAEQLPDYMIPAHFVVLPAMPLTPNGKINRLTLPAPTMQRPSLATQLVTPQTRIEQLIAKSWQETLRVELVGIHDNFFELGGNSLLLTQAYAKLLNEDEMGGQGAADISTTTLLEYPTIYTLAQFISRQTQTANTGVYSGAEPARGQTAAADKQNDRRSRRTELVERRAQRTRR